MTHVIEDLEPREAYIKLKCRWLRGSRTIKFRSVTVVKTKATWEHIQALRDYYASLLLCAVEDIQAVSVTPAYAFTDRPTLRRRG